MLLLDFALAWETRKKCVCVGGGGSGGGNGNQSNNSTLGQY